MKRCETLLRTLSPLMSVSGFERQETDALRTLLAAFPEYQTDAYGNHFFYLRSGKADAPLLLFDTHFDEIGMLVSDFVGEGFVRVVAVGGVDAHVLPASQVFLYPRGGAPIPAVVVSTPPHLQKAGEGDNITPVKELLLDTGYTAEELRKLVTIGTPVGFAPTVTALGGDDTPTDKLQLCGKAFDNKASVAAAVRAAELLAEAGDLPCDVCLALSAKEEMGHWNPRTVAESAHPDAAIVLDVTFATTPNVGKDESAELYGGPVISLSAILSKSLTRALRDTAKTTEIPHTLFVDAASTGTNANLLPLCGEGIPTALVSIPLKSMHTPSEVISVFDVYQTANLLAAFVRGGFSTWQQN